MHFETTVEIDAPPDRVWATLIDVERWPEWTASVTKVERLGAGPLAPAAKTRVKQPRLSPLVWEVTDFDPLQGFTWRSASPGVTTVGSHRIRAAANDRVTVTLGIEQSGALAPVVGWFISKRTRRYVQMEAEGLKARCEA
jgi:uncharacterized membrane protein